MVLDIAREVGSVAHVSDLVRTQQGMFKLGQSVLPTETFPEADEIIKEMERNGFPVSLPEFTARGGGHGVERSEERAREVRERWGGVKGKRGGGPWGTEAAA